jgi:hypothetical protein
MTTEAQKRANQKWRQTHKEQHSQNTVKHMTVYRLRWKEFNKESARLRKIDC